MKGISQVTFQAIGLYSAKRLCKLKKIKQVFILKW